MYRTHNAAQGMTIALLVFLTCPARGEDLLADPAEGAATTASAPALVSHNSFLARHLRFLTVEGASRFRYLDRAPGDVRDRDLQYKISTRVRIDLVGEAKTYLQLRGETGRSFTSSWDYTGIGRNDRYWSFNLKSLFLGQKIGSRLEAQAGGVEYDWGAGTEATYADNDAWLVGYRLKYSVKGPGWMPDRISATVGYVGDFSQPNVFARLPRMGEENYIQILAAKKLGKNHEVSGEFDSIQGVRYSREAVRLRKLPLLLVDELGAEVITRATDNRSFGWSGSLGRQLDGKGRWRAGVFYSDLPKNIFVRNGTTVLQNGDTYALGKRIGPTFRAVPFENLEISVLASGRLDNTPGTRYRGQFQVRYQCAALLNRMLQLGRPSPNQP